MEGGVEDGDLVDARAQDAVDLLDAFELETVMLGGELALIGDRFAYIAGEKGSLAIRSAAMDNAMADDVDITRTVDNLGIAAPERFENARYCLRE